MSHTAAGMTSMQHTPKSLGKIITGIHRSGEMFHDKVALFAPFLNGKVLDLDVSSTRRGPRFVDHMQRCKIIDQQTGWTRSESAEFVKEETKTFDNLGGGFFDGSRLTWRS